MCKQCSESHERSRNFAVDEVVEGEVDMLAGRSQAPEIRKPAAARDSLRGFEGVAEADGCNLPAAPALATDILLVAGIPVLAIGSQRPVVDPVAKGEAVVDGRVVVPKDRGVAIVQHLAQPRVEKPTASRKCSATVVGGGRSVVGTRGLVRRMKIRKKIPKDKELT